MIDAQQRAYAAVKTFVAGVVKDQVWGNRLADTARTIARRTIDSSSGIHKLVQDFQATCSGIDRAKIKAIGKSAPAFKSNHLMQLVGFAAVERFGIPTAADIAFVDAHCNQLKDDPSTEWFYPKVTAIAIGLRHVEETMWQVDRLSTKPFLKQYYATTNDDFRETADELFAGISELRRYGIKPAYFEQLTGCDAWTFFDARDMGDALPQGWLNDSVLAYAALSHEPKKNDALVLNHVSVVGKNVNTSGWGCRESHVSWHVLKDGHFDQSLGYGILRPKKLFAERGLEFAYELLRLMHGVRLFDLTVSQITVERTWRSSVGRRLMRRLASSNLAPLFAVPRIKALYNMAEIEAEIQEEIECDLAETERRLKRKHDVVCFRRTLPKGCRPSQTAIELAKEAGFILQPGETFVRKHERGKGEPAMPQFRRAVSRG